MDAEGAIYPVVYLRSGGRVTRELIMDTHPLHAFAG
jgi:hypothetical protein